MRQMSKRVVITGMGVISPIGNNVEDMWQGVKEGRCGVGPITHYEVGDRKVSLAAEVKNFNPEDFRKKYPPSEISFGGYF